MAFMSKKDIANEFLYAWYKKHGNIIGIRYAQGTKQQNLSYDIIEKFNISYPCIKEQEKLIRFISLIDERIATQTKIIEKYESLIQAIIYKAKIDGISKGTWRRIDLCKVLQERNEKNVEGKTICSVSVSQGVVNQIEYLGCSFAAKQTGYYNVVKYGDIVYRQFEATGLQAFDIHYHTSVFGMKQFHEPAAGTDEDEDITVLHLALHFLMYHSA